MKSPRGVRSLRIASYLLSATLSAVSLDVYAQVAPTQDADASVDAGMPDGSSSADVDPDAGVPVGDAAAPPAPAAPSVEPPQLLTAADAEYPADALAQGLGAVVPLRLTINDQGVVTDAEVLEPQGHGFDEAARAAALRFAFTPARKNGVAMPSRTVYRYTFTPPPPPTPPPVTPIPEPPSTPSAATPPTPESPVDVTLQGRVDHAARMERSAESVDVIDLSKLRARSLDTSDVLARTEGIVVRRSGALGSQLRLMLDGLDEERIRFFVDTVPLELAGYLVGPQTVTVDMVDRLEIYRGVVPVRFGADTLGGVIHYVTDDSFKTTARASYEIASFNTHRALLSGSHHLDEQHLLVRGQANLDYSANNYPIDVKIADERGRPHDARVDRFHDGYLGYLGWVEGGMVDAPWIKRLLLRIYASEYDKELQHNIVMSVPYGEARYGGGTYGATLRAVHEDLLADHTELSAVLNISRTTVDFVDVGEWVYNWRGERVRERTRPGEVTDQPTSVIQWQTGYYDRLGLKWQPVPEHALLLSTAREYITRTGDDRLQTEGRDPEQADRDYFTMVSGVEWESKWWRERIENQIFAKHYWLDTNTEEVIPGGVFRRRDHDHHRFGVGDGARLRFTSWLWLKTSYELATKLPETYQLFGDGVLVQSNLELVPETSHNVNLSLHVDWKQRGFGRVTGNLRGFVRRQDNLILLLGNDRNFMYQNVYEVFAHGVVADVQWEAPRERITANANITWQDLTNVSTSGTFEGFRGDMLPNRPWLFANLGTSTRIPKVFSDDGAVLAGWDLHYTPWFYRGWESQGDPRFKQKIPTQLVNDVYVTYEWEGTPRWSATISVDNVFDAKVFENFGAQRPGRSFSLKVAAEL